jgi:acyl carrier protein
MNPRNIVVKEISAPEIQDWLVAYIANLLEIESEEIDVTIPFDRYGLDSSAAVGMTGDLEDWLGKEVEPILLYDYPTIEALARHLSIN